MVEQGRGDNRMKRGDAVRDTGYYWVWLRRDDRAGWQLGKWSYEDGRWIIVNALHANVHSRYTERQLARLHHDDKPLITQAIVEPAPPE